MAEMDTSSGGGHKKGPGVKKGKKLSTRVDLTPMVDLGFLLITFFIFTTTMSQPTTMKLAMPKDDVKDIDLTKIKESGSLTILLGKDNHLFYYEGMDPTKLQSTNYGKIREVILNKKKSTAVDDLFITVKPNSDATYKNAVDVLDEMTINDIKRYAMTDPNDAEKMVVKLTEDANVGH
jgi:biopolymer transport protein ExbD